MNQFFNGAEFNQEKVDEVAHAIENVITNRTERGASDKSLIGWLEHLKRDVWMNTPQLVNLCDEFIDAIKQTPLIAN